MASIVSAAASATFICSAPGAKFAAGKKTTLSNINHAGGLKMAPGIQISKVAATKSSPISRRGFKSRISCFSAEAETLEIVTTTIAKQLSVDEGRVTPQTKFSELGADSLDTVEIMMALEEKCQVSIGETGVENIVTVQDAANLIEKVKKKAASN